MVNEAMKGDSNMHRWISNTPFMPNYTKLSNEIEWEEERDLRPINSHYNVDKGYKFDVPTPYEERVPHVADRLGYPEQLGTPLERLFRLDQDLSHPQYLDQPFVQTPSPGPDASLNFQEGEVVYENQRIAEWNRLFVGGGAFFAAFTGLYIPYLCWFKTSIPWSVMTEGIPGIQYFEHSMNFFDTYNITAVMLVPAMAVSFATWMKLLQKQCDPYVSRIQYNADQELLFVTSNNIDGIELITCYEMEHLEIVPPSVKSSVQHMSSQDDDGLIMITDLNKDKNFFLYKEDVYWNPALKKLFLERTTRLWDETFYDETKVKTYEPNVDQKILQIE